MGYYDLVLAQAPTLLLPLDDSSGAARNLGSAGTTTQRGTPDYRTASSPIGKCPGSFLNGWFSRTTGLAVGRTTYTIAAWVRTTSVDSGRGYGGNPANCVAGDWSNSVLRGFGVHNGKAELTRFTTGLAWVYTSSTVSVNDDAWHLIAAAVLGDRINIIVDGVQDTQATPASEWNTGGSFDVFGGGYGTAVETTSGDRFDGAIAGLFITAADMTPAQLLVLYRTGVRELVSY